MQDCPDFWMGVDAFCYRFNGSRQAWSTANETCQAMHAELPSMTDVTDIAVLDEFHSTFGSNSLSLSCYQGYWTGHKRRVATWNSSDEFECLASVAPKNVHDRGSGPRSLELRSCASRMLFFCVQPAGLPQR
ncbi:killer cell lectin-like receptor subfamily G member 2 [Diadema antillarum]|uniref:killer cell lectin-like receptor subfamily G member 2 n=1 Tax=Diadema antillarum TaxID=105358 RepID=UPI003A86B2A5